MINYSFYLYNNKNYVPTRNNYITSNTKNNFITSNDREKYNNIIASYSEISFFNLDYYRYSSYLYDYNDIKCKLLLLLLDGVYGDKLTNSMEININDSLNINENILCNVCKPGSQIKIKNNNYNFTIRPEGNDTNITGVRVITKKKNNLDKLNLLLTNMENNIQLFIKNKDDKDEFKKLLYEDNDNIKLDKLNKKRDCCI